MVSPSSLLHDQYEILYTVEEQPDGAVYRARNIQTHGPVLIGAFPQPDAESLHDAHVVAEQIAEMVTAGMLAVRHVFAEAHVCYVVVDDPGGEDLDRIAFDYRTSDTMSARSVFLEELALEQGERLLLALERLHDATPPLLLGELRSSDIWASQQGDLMLAPFPIIRTIGSEVSGYGAPELANADQEPTIPSDMYACGALIYRLLTGWTPPTAAERSAGVPLLPPHELRDDISPMTSQAVMRALEIEPINRYQRASEMREAFRVVRLFRGEWATVGPLVPIKMTPSRPESEPLPATTESPPEQPDGVSIGVPRRMNTYLMMTIGFLSVLALIICGVGASLLTPNGRTFFATVLTQDIPRRILPNNPRPTATPMSPPHATGVLTPSLITTDTITRVREIHRIDQAELGPVVIAPDGHTLAMGIGQSVIVSSTVGVTHTINVTGTIGITGSELLTPTHHVLGMHHGQVTSLAFARVVTGTETRLLLASGGVNDQRVQLWDVERGERVVELDGHTGWIRSLAASPDGQFLASGSTDGTIIVWNLAQGSKQATLQGHTDWLGNIAFNGDGSLLVSASRDGSVRLWDVTRGEEVRYKGKPFFVAPTNPETGKPFWMTGVAFQADGDLIAASSASGDIVILERATGTVLHVLRGHVGWVVIRGLVFSRDGTMVVSAGLDGTIRWWNVERGTMETVLETGHPVLGIAWHPDGQHVLTSSDASGEVVFWTAQEGAMTRLPIADGHAVSLAYSPDRSRLAMGGYHGRIRVISRAGSNEDAVDGGSGTSQMFDFVDNQSVVVATNALSRSVVIEELSSGKREELSNLDGGATHVVVNNDGTLIAATGHDQVATWDVQTRRHLRSFEGILGERTALALSRDSRALLVAGRRADANDDDMASVVAVWSIATGNLLRTFEEHHAPIRAIATHPISETVASISARELLIWNQATGEIVRNITPVTGTGQLTGVAFVAEGKLIVTTSNTGEVSFWDMTSDLPVFTVMVSGEVLALAVCPRGEEIAVSTTSGTIHILGVAPDE